VKFETTFVLCSRTEEGVDFIFGHEPLLFPGAARRRPPTSAEARKTREIAFGLSPF
jgi:hypothetical protein